MAAKGATAVMRELFDAFNAKDLDRVESLAAEDFELLDVASGEVFRGPPGARRKRMSRSS